jgi:hypothetical protein
MPAAKPAQQSMALMKYSSMVLQANGVKRNYLSLMWQLAVNFISFFGVGKNGSHAGTAPMDSTRPLAGGLVEFRLQ